MSKSGMALSSWRRQSLPNSARWTDGLIIAVSVRRYRILRARRWAAHNVHRGERRRRLSWWRRVGRCLRRALPRKACLARPRRPAAGAVPMRHAAHLERGCHALQAVLWVAVVQLAALASMPHPALLCGQRRRPWAKAAAHDGGLASFSGVTFASADRRTRARPSEQTVERGRYGPRSSYP